MTGTTDPPRTAALVPTSGMPGRVLSRLSGWLDSKIGLPFDRLRFRVSLRHLSGPRKIDLPREAVTVVALVRDGAYYLDVFLAHYRALGVSHFVFCDTGSTDGTLAQLAQEPDVTVLQSRLPWGRFENIFRGYAARTFSADRWCLFADMDEILEFEGQAQLGLNGLVRYLNRHGYSAMMAQMLEMFPQAPLRSVAQQSYPEVQQSFCHYDISAVRALPYHDPATGLGFFLSRNQIPDAPPPKMQFGGIRGAVFGERCCLSKHPLVFVDADTDPAVHPHVSTGVRVADTMAVLKHYKFANDPMARDQASLKAASIPHGEDALRVAGFAKRPDLTLWSQTAQKYNGPETGPEALREAGFLQVSARYLTEILD
ncbi:glycosyltransferase family 2 protein [Phaeobacter inhibens]|uniref:glycosyltransferase family 2 protein n=1 Tax=Phaeobacter inhibens TaxID=221822 RepID=UPI0021A3136E|nr:glycosyltransferase family 2 protein [Phaeobacter inhibens]UWR76906.1 glycosyltransferase family 2 protein [Phaeobacter inhibens]